MYNRRFFLICQFPYQKIKMNKKWRVAWSKMSLESCQTNQWNI